ncbi:hypothetical protein AAFN86_18285 [Roseomonas sp. CAU 1739]|uniref:hypothetical protein n=1 Tax=Roseomonas sp. CAU 1739 TaxID=3140364 RepID=UPI00325A7D07
MVDVVCLECALAFRNEMMDIVVADGNDTIVFPHVDSCVAVVFLHAGGKATGGHVSLTAASGGFGEALSLTEMLGRMLDWTPDPVQQVIFIGHHDWRGVCDTVIASQPKLAAVPYANVCRFNDPLDIFVELGSQKLRVQNWQKDTARHETVAPARSGHWIYDENLPTGS